LEIKKRVLPLPCKQKQKDMKALNTTTEKQARLVEFAKSLGITIEKLTEWYKDPVKASMLNVMANGL